MWEEKEDFNKTYKTLMFLNFLAVAGFPSLFCKTWFCQVSPKPCLLLLSLIPALGRRAIPVAEAILLSQSLEGRDSQGSSCSSLAGSGAEMWMG